jgi:hypothetical protein
MSGKANITKGKMLQLNQLFGEYSCIQYYYYIILLYNSAPLFMNHNISNSLRLQNISEIESKLEPNDEDDGQDGL